VAITEDIYEVWNNWAYRFGHEDDVPSAMLLLEAACGKCIYGARHTCRGKCHVVRWRSDESEDRYDEWHSICSGALSILRHGWERDRRVGVRRIACQEWVDGEIHEELWVREIDPVPQF